MCLLRRNDLDQYILRPFDSSVSVIIQRSKSSDPSDRQIVESSYHQIPAECNIFESERRIRHFLLVDHLLNPAVIERDIKEIRENKRKNARLKMIALTELQNQIIILLSLLIGGFLLLNRSSRHIIYVIYKTLPRDLSALVRFIRINILLWWWQKRKYTVAKLFSEYAAAHPEKIAYIFEDEEWNYKQLEEFSNRIGRYFHTKMFDSVAVFMGNRPEYIGIWLGLSKTGFVSALVNTNLRYDALLHSIKIGNCKAIIFGSELKEAIRDIKDKIPGIKLYQWSEEAGASILEGAVDLNAEISSIDPGPLRLDLGNPQDKLIYVYTSGTTGLPKAAIINNIRYILISYGMYIMLKVRSDDRFYNSLPLYHTAGGILGAGQALVCGIPVVLRRRFSASNFWSDCIRYECTVAQYIGEICRFLLAVPPSQYDTSHKVRLMIGNGMRLQIWESFVNRFAIKQIGELYGTTEGNSNIVNIDNKVGAVGFIPRYITSFGLLVKINEETEELLRGPDGLCIRCKPGEPGLFVGKINPYNTRQSFVGYVDKEASKKKILHDVFKKGDCVFNSGDILIMDEFGYFYFKDRTGDTFRWRGENVATSEVEAIISNIIDLKDTIVYGVQIPGNEGKAGMASIYDSDNSLNIEVMAEKFQKYLPNYARPRFIRILSTLQITGTYKLQKKDLQQDGFNIKKIKDPIYFLNKNIYTRLTDELYNDIMEEKLLLS